MRSIKAIGLAAVAAMIAMALLGASSASAWEFCEKQEEAPCESRYAQGQEFTGELEAETTAHFAGASEATCKSAGIGFTQLSEFGSPVEEVTAATFGNCNNTVAAVDLPWEMRVVDVSGGGGVWKATVTEFGAGQPGVTVGGCKYTAAEMLLKIHDTSFTAGPPELFGTVPLTGPCGSETFTVRYLLGLPIYPG